MRFEEVIALRISSSKLHHVKFVSYKWQKKQENEVELFIVKHKTLWTAENFASDVIEARGDIFCFGNTMHLR